MPELRWTGPGRFSYQGERYDPGETVEVDQETAEEFRSHFSDGWEDAEDAVAQDDDADAEDTSDTPGASGADPDDLPEPGSDDESGDGPVAGAGSDATIETARGEDADAEEADTEENDGEDAESEAEDDGGEDADAEEADALPFDPGEYTVDELSDELDSGDYDADTLDALYDAEESGRGRKTALENIEDARE